MCLEGDTLVELICIQLDPLPNLPRPKWLDIPMAALTCQQAEQWHHHRRPPVEEEWGESRALHVVSRCLVEGRVGRAQYFLAGCW